MSNRKNTKHALFSSVMSLILCISMLLGSTYAWFTDTATANVNLIQSGELKVDLVDENEDTLVGKSLAFQKATDGEGEEVLWEPGVTYETQKFYVKNIGNLALKFKIAINGLEGDVELLNAIDFYLQDENGNRLNLEEYEEDLLKPQDKSVGYTLVGKMKTTAGNEYQDKKLDGVSITVYATQASGDGAENDSYGNLYDRLADYSIFVTKTKTLASGASSVDFEIDYNGLVIANVSVPASAIADASKPVTVTFDGINPAETITVGENIKSYAYDIDVSNLKDNLTADQQVTVVLTTPNALPDAKVYHNGVLMDNTTYEEVEGTITFTTDSFSPFAVSYTEIEVATLQELREAVLKEDVCIKLTADIKVDFNNQTLNGVADTSVRDKDHSWTVSNYKNPEHTYYFVALVQGNVTIDLNGHEIHAIDRKDDGYMWCGASITVDRNGSLNFTDTAGGGTMKAEGELPAIWAAFAHDEDWCDIYDGIFMRDSYVHAGDNWNECLIYGAYDNDDLGLINVYGGYYLYNNFTGDRSGHSGAFNIGDKATFESIRIHDGVMMVDSRYRQTTGTDDDSIKLADGCEILKVTLDTPITIEGVEYATWYQVQTTKPTFETVFENTDTYLYRVGNSNTIKLGSLFQATNPNSTISENATITVSVEGLDSSTNVAGTYTAASTPADWANGTIKFTGSGPAKITINGYELLVEVVNGKNVTVASELANNTNLVLLNDIALTSGKTYVNLGSSTLHGNGFTIDYAGYGKHSSNTYGVVQVNGGTIDNVKLIGDTYTTFTDTSTDEWYAATVYASGSSRITNSYLHGCQAALRVQGSSCLVENTTLSGGRYTNLHMKQGVLTLKNVTTTQERVVVDGTTYLGFGVVVWEDAPAGTAIKIDGDLTQYNWVTEADQNYLPGTAANYVDTAFGFPQYVYSYDGTDYVNLGIISISSDVLKDCIEVPNGYSSEDVNGKACVVTYDNTIDGTLLNSGVPTYVGWGATAQGAIRPTFTWSYPGEYNSSNNTISTTFEEGSSYTLDPNILTATKNGANLNVTVSMDGTDYTGKSITFTATGDHTLTYTVTDPYNYDATAAKSNATYTFTKAVSVTAMAPEAAHAEFTYTAGQAATVVEIGGKNYVMPNVSGTSSTIASTTVSGTTVYMPIVSAVYKDNSSDFDGYAPIFTAVTIKDYAGGLPTGATTTYNSSSTSLPANWGKSSGSPYITGAASTTADPVIYSSYGLCYQSTKGSDISAQTQTVCYYYTDNAGETYYYYVQYSFAAHTCPSNCITSDTLVTLADGTQKRVDALTGEEQLLVWNLETGKYDTAPIVFVDSDEKAEYDVIHLYFSDGSDVKVIYEHGFFDLDLGKYVYIDAANYNDYVGHRFVTQGDINSNDWNVVTLDEVVLETEVTTAWSPVTFEHLCYYTNGVLSMPGGIDGLFNIFEVDTDTMTYDAELMQKDIETYGLFTYEDFGGLIPEIAFEAFNGDYLKVAIGKGLLTWEDIAYLAERYMPLM